MALLEMPVMGFSVLPAREEEFMSGVGYGFRREVVVSERSVRAFRLVGGYHSPSGRSGPHESDCASVPFQPPEKDVSVNADRKVRGRAMHQGISGIRKGPGVEPGPILGKHSQCFPAPQVVNQG